MKEKWSDMVQPKHDYRDPMDWMLECVVELATAGALIGLGYLVLTAF